MKKLNLIILAVILLFGNWINAQNNNIITLPPKYIDLNNTIKNLPIPQEGYYLGSGIPNDPLDPYDAYDGQISENTHNGMRDESGQLLFFIIDGLVYDKDGYYIGEMNLLSNSNYHVNGSSETLIIPDPADCDRYYLVADGSPFQNHNKTSNTWYCVLDLTPDYYFPYPPIPEVIDHAILPGSLLGNIKNYFNLHAVSQLKDNNSRFLFLVSLGKIYRYLVDANGINLENVYSHSNYTYAYASGDIRSELELIETLNDNNQPIYRISYAYIGSDHKIIIYIADLDINTGDVIAGTEEFIVYQGNMTEVPLIHGLEFSPDGDVLYITHETTNAYPNAIEYYFVGSGTSPTSLNIPTHLDFQYSQIELSHDNEILFVTDDRLAALASPNSPSPSNWQDTYLSGLNYNYNNGIIITYSSSGHGKYAILLPDQIDGMDYSTAGDIPITILGDNEICEGESTTLSISFPISGVIYTWVNSNGNIVGTGNSITVSPTTDETYTVTGLINSCDGQNAFHVTVTPKPSLDLGEDIILCEGDNLPVTISSGHAKGYTYNWTLDGNFYASTSYVQADYEGEYCLHITQNSTGCSNDDCVLVKFDERLDNTAEFDYTVSCPNGNNYIEIDIDVAPFNGYSPPNYMITQYKIYEYTSSGSLLYLTYYNTIADDFDFTFGGTPSSGNAKPGFFTQDKSYVIERRIMSYPGGCLPWTSHFSDVISCTAKNGTQTSNTYEEMETVVKTRAMTSLEMTLYPNPTSGNVTINLSNNTGNEQVEIIDHMGKVVLKDQINTATKTLDVNHLANGIYLVRIISGDQVTTEKLIKQ